MTMRRMNDGPTRANGTPAKDRKARTAKHGSQSTDRKVRIAKQ